MKRILLAIATIMALLAGLMPVAAFAADTSTGSFVVANVASTVGTIVSTSPWTPMAAWTTITVPVTDSNTLADVKLVTVTVYYDSAGTDVMAVPGSANVQNCAILTWTRSTGLWTIDQGTGTTWAINGAGCSKADDALSTGNWVFSFKVGEVATETTGGSDWDISATVTDTADATGTNTLFNIAMNWYGAITVTTTTAPFGTVALDSGFAFNLNKITGISVTYIANGDYAQQVKSANWDNGATFDATGDCSTAKYFSLKAYKNNTDITDAGTFTTNAVQVTLAGASIDATGTQTAEAGNTVATNVLWLRVASVFPVATYSGAITYIVANR